MGLCLLACTRCYCNDLCYFWIYRGYGDTERPANKKDYEMNSLIQDIAELIPALGYKSCVLVAHDWGGVLAWYVS